MQINIKTGYYFVISEMVKGEALFVSRHGPFMDLDDLTIMSWAELIYDNPPCSDDPGLFLEGYSGRNVKHGKAKQFITTFHETPCYYSMMDKTWKEMR